MKYRNRKNHNNYSWQVIAESASSGTLSKYVIYGNFIDEPVFAGVTGSYYYYLHDHLYNTAALVNYNTGNVLERYEYNAYGKVNIYDANFTPRSATNYNNNILFTGRETDFIHSDQLKLQYNRNRYYCSRLGRWMTQDPLGIVPNGQFTNNFQVTEQFTDGLNIYNYAKSNSIKYSDLQGLGCKISYRCYKVSSTPGYGGCKKRCTYRCFEIPESRIPIPGGAYGCDDVPTLDINGPVEIKWSTSLCCWITRGRKGRKAGECQDTYIHHRYYNIEEDLPGRDCSRSDCRSGCVKTYKAAKLACNLLKCPQAKRACKAIAITAKAACQIGCDTWCRRE